MIRDAKLSGTSIMGGSLEGGRWSDEDTQEGTDFYVLFHVCESRTLIFSIAGTDNRHPRYRSWKEPTGSASMSLLSDALITGSGK